MLWSHFIQGPGTNLGPPAGCCWGKASPYSQGFTGTSERTPGPSLFPASGSLSWVPLRADGSSFGAWGPLAQGWLKLLELLTPAGPGLDGIRGILVWGLGIDHRSVAHRDGLYWKQEAQWGFVSLVPWEK